MTSVNELKSASGPLAGLTVLDLTRVLSGPFAAMWLGTMGANVIKIEDPGHPDVTRDYGPYLNEKSTYYPTVNHNKRSITLNLKAEEGKKLFLDLVQIADVVIENYRPNVMDKLGLGYEKLKKVNQGIVYASISGYGTYGPYSERPGYDVTAQAMSGIMFMTGPSGGEPTRVGSSVADTVGGVTSLVALLAALYRKMKTGIGQKVEVSLVDAMISLSTQDYIRYFVNGEIPTRMGNIYKTWTPYGTYRASDGYYNLGCGTDRHFQLFAKAIGRPELGEMAEYRTHADRVSHRQQLDDIINAWAADKTVHEIIDLMVDQGVPCAPVNSIVELEKDDHIAGAREMFPTLIQPGVGEFKVTNIPVRFSDSGLAPLIHAPDLGEHNEEVYGMIGRTAEDLKHLHAQGVI